MAKRQDDLPGIPKVRKAVVRRKIWEVLGGMADDTRDMAGRVYTHAPDWANKLQEARALIHEVCAHFKDKLPEV